MPGCHAATRMPHPKAVLPRVPRLLQWVIVELAFRDPDKSGARFRRRASAGPNPRDSRSRLNGNERGAATSTAVSGYRVDMPRGDSRESLLHRALPVYLGLLFAVLTVVAVVLLFMVRHVLLVLFVSVLFAAALSGPSEWLHRRSRLPLGLAAVLIYICASRSSRDRLGVVPPLLGQVVEFADRAPEYAERYEGIRGRTPSFGPTSRCCHRSPNSCRGSETRSSTGQASGQRRFRRRLLDLH